MVGSSGGGSLALRLAQTRPADVYALALINPSVIYRSPLKPVAGLLSRVVPTFPGLGNDTARPGATLDYDADLIAERTLAFITRHGTAPEVGEGDTGRSADA